MFITPKKFAEKTGENYDLILDLCKKGNIKCERTDGGHFKIYDTELDKFTKQNEDFISREQYEAVIRENERLKSFITQLKTIVTSCN